MKDIKIAVIDGQGGGIGSIIVEKLKTEFPNINIIALGTNSVATGRMLKAGADQGATGENALIYNVKNVDIIMGVVAVLMPNAMMGWKGNPFLNKFIPNKDLPFKYPLCSHF